MKNAWADLMVKVAVFVGALFGMLAIAFGEVTDMKYDASMAVEAAQMPLPLHPISATILQDPEGRVVGFIQMDVLGLVNRDERRAMRSRREEVRERRKNMSAGEIAKDHLANNWGKYLAAGAAFVVADQTVIKNNEWLWHKKSTGRRAGGDLIGDDTATAIALSNNISGNGNAITQNIVIQAPQGSGTGMQGNTGDGGLGNLNDSQNRTGE